MPGPPLLHEFPSAVPELPRARARLRQWLEHSVDDAEARQDLLLAGAELCTGAVQRRAGGPIALRAWVEDAAVVIEVTGPSRDLPDASVTTLVGSGGEARCRARILEQICDETCTTVKAGTRSDRCRRRTARRPAG